MSTPALFDREPAIKIGRTTHRYRVTIENRKVMVRTRCGKDITDAATQTVDLVSCTACQATA